MLNSWISDSTLQILGTKTLPQSWKIFPVELNTLSISNEMTNIVYLSMSNIFYLYDIYENSDFLMTTWGVDE